MLGMLGKNIFLRGTSEFVVLDSNWDCVGRNGVNTCRRVGDDRICVYVIVSTIMCSVFFSTL